MTLIKYDIVLTERAKQDLNNIYEYISQMLLAKVAASNLMDKIEKNILRLEYMPESGSVLEMRNSNKYRKLVINKYIAIYRINKEERKVYIIRIVYGKRDYLKEV